MAPERASATKLRSFITRRFILITVIAVAFVMLFVAFEDLVFAQFIANVTNTQVSEAPCQALHLLALLIGNAFFGAELGISAGASVQLFGLCILMLALIAAPVVIGAVVFSRMAERRIIADQRIREEELAQFYRNRNLMISDMAHDLRTPVMSISGLSQALSDGIVTEEESRQRYLHAIHAKSDKMADLVTMLFDFVQLDSEGYELDRTVLDLPQLVLREAAAAYTDVEDAGMRLRIEVPEEPVSVFADEKQLSRVVANLIANAVRHNAPGTTIVIGLNRRAGVADVIVADDGKVIESDAEKLFEPFTREDSARSGGGSGLGLSIVKSIVDMHGYQIRLMQPYGLYTKAFVVSCGVEG